MKKPWMNLFLFTLLAVLAFGAPAAFADTEAPATENEASAIMNEPLDGSSQTALDASLARVESEATAAEFTRLKNAIGMMQAYDMGIRSNPALLPTRLNGKTPTEVLALAKERWNL